MMRLSSSGPLIDISPVDDIAIAIAVVIGITL
jgi:hypothetical protein